MKRFIVCAFLATQLFACASLEPLRQQVTSGSFVGNSERILAVKHWSLMGRLSVRNKKESWLTSLSWKHKDSINQLTLSTLLGGIVATLAYSKEGVWVSDSDGNMHEASSAELHSMLGYSPPLRHLHFWITGVPNPNLMIENEASNSLGVHSFKQDGWDVKLERFNFFADVFLPTRVTLFKDELKIKLVVDEWSM
ncbi:MAG TPA: outer membrane lipoprotein LolB [Cycloclasticus sp.]|nr:outer membrane lipoprotein LolB [Cycloclasticus sp.]HIL92774.1 outer membrane lipoprotein LolB [Cycloclasticus sp.]